MEESRPFVTSMDEDGATTVDGRSVSTRQSSAGGRAPPRKHGRHDSALSHCSTLSGLSSSVFSGSSDVLSSSTSSSASHARQLSSSLSSSSSSSTTTAAAAPSGASSAAASAAAAAVPPSFSLSSPTKWSTPPGTPTKSKLRAEYQARLSSSPLKRRMHSSPVAGGGDSPFGSPSSSSASKRPNDSPLSVRRAASDDGAGSEYGDRFVPARRSAQMEIAYALLHDGDDDENDACTSPFGTRRGGLFSDLASPASSSSSLGRLASLTMSAAVSGPGAGTAGTANASGMASPNGATAAAAAAAAAATAAASSTNMRAPTGAGEVTGGREGQNLLNILLANELLGVEAHPHHPASYPRNYPAANAADAAAQAVGNTNDAGGAFAGAAAADAASGGAAAATTAPSTPPRRPLGASSRTAPALLAFRSARERHHAEAARNLSFTGGSAGLLPVGDGSRRLLATPRKAKRKISKVPFKVLDAPGIQDDFYLQVVDWSALNVLAVGLGACVYLWSACTSKVTKLCDLGQGDCVTSVGWTQRGTHLAVGTNQGEVQLWDAAKCRKVRAMTSHSARIGTLAWNAQTLASGSRDRCIHLHDARAREPYTARLQAHRQEVCGLRWSFDDAQLASGGNDNKLYVWSPAALGHGPVQRFTDHTAAVKAIAWSPHQNSLLASGGGTADRCIRFWNTATGAALSAVDTGSQVCNLMWSRTVNEIVSTHGYSLNQIILWRYPNMSKVATLTGHTYRVLYLAMSPDGQTIVTGAGDETLRFWSAFPGTTKSTDHVSSRLGPSLLLPSAGHDIR